MGFELLFRNVARGLPHDCRQGSGVQFIVQWDSQGLFLASGARSPQLYVAAPLRVHRKAKPAKDGDYLAT
jgi:hypothetical protein